MFLTRRPETDEFVIKKSGWEWKILSIFQEIRINVLQVFSDTL